MGKIYKETEIQETEQANTTSFLSIGTYVEPVDDVIHRDNEISRVYAIMNRSMYRSVLLVGDTGIGKRAIIEGFVKKMRDESRNDKIINLDFRMMLEGIEKPSDYKQVLNNIFRTVEDDTETESVLTIHNIGHFLQQQCYSNGGYSFLDELPKEIEFNGLRIIATTTNKELKDLEDSFPCLLDYFTVIKLTELSKDQTVEIIQNEIEDYVDYYHISLPKNTAEVICSNADKYVKDRPFPLKAEMLLDEVCSVICGKNNNNKEASTLIEENSNLKLQLIDFLEKGDYAKCDELNKEITENDKKIYKINNNRRKVKATEYDILEAIGMTVNVKMSKLSSDQTQFLKEMPIELKKNVIGQDETIDKIVKNIRRNQLGLRKRAHSAGNFIFIGSTGVGKTHLAKQLAKYLYGSEDNMLRFDMSEFQSEIDVSKLLGSAPGYVGYKESGLLVKGLAKKPESVVLFDEIEKAHPKIYDVLLQLLDEGSVTGSDGRKVDGSKALIIFTSNIGVRSAKELSTPVGFTKNAFEDQAKKEESIMQKALRKRFSPEFINRLDGICYFNPLGHDTLLSILNKELKEMNVGIQQITGKEVVMSDEVNEWLIKKVEDEKNGARPIIRLLQQEIEEQIANLVIEDDSILKTRKKTITARMDGDSIILK